MTQVFVFWLVLQWIGGGHLARSEAHSGIFNDQDIQRHDSACTGKMNTGIEEAVENICMF